jgi:outer membrane protein OmpA-like peptidoglycan-associated protein
VQLIGAASSEGPEDYNFDLAKRRALAVADALEREGIDRGRIADPAENELRGECKPIGTGLRSCGELGADASDRRVLARVFGLR